MQLLEDRVAVVTGAGRGIGRAVAETMVRWGGSVVINDLDEEPAKEAVAACDAIAPGRAVASIGSVVDPKYTDALMETAATRFGKLDILVNNAGMTRDRMVHKMSDEEWDFVIDVKGVNPWSTKGGHRKWWDLLHLAGERHGLKPIRGRNGRLLELPHMQLISYSWRDCKVGNWPAGGDEPWVWNLHEAAMRYPKGAPELLPDYPEDELECRPPL